MTIDEAIHHLNTWSTTHGSGQTTDKQHEEAKKIAIDTMRKYQKIEPKTGHWMNKEHLFESCSAECSSCHKRSNGYVHDNGFSLEFKYFDFCPNCGARMVEPQESEG